MLFTLVQMKPCKITCISDLHGSYPDLPGGDLLIVGGDLTVRNYAYEYGIFNDWLESQNYTKKIVIAGNHDGLIEKRLYTFPHYDHALDIEYLEDTGTEFMGLKIWGTPWTPKFMDWYFMKEPEEMKEVCAKIPKDTDILVTHGPPYGILDRNKEEDPCGCKYLREWIDTHKPKLHVFGHIHEGYGIYDEGWTLCINASHMNWCYNPSNEPISIQLTGD
jgi:Icc-related predicted phosphoesterase